MQIIQKTEQKFKKKSLKPIKMWFQIIENRQKKIYRNF